MTNSLLLEHIRRHVPINESEEIQLLAVIKSKKLRRKQLLFEEGDVHRHAVFVHAGCLRSYSIDANGFEHILQFAPPGWWIGDIRSFNRQVPGTLFVDAVDSSEILLLQKADLDTLYEKIPQLERFFRIIAENALATYQHRLIDTLSLPAMERYQNFCTLYPSLTECLPQKLVASYIGVTPEFLSKMLHLKKNAKRENS